MTFFVQLVDGRYHCPYTSSENVKCTSSYEKINSLYHHAKRSHQIRVSIMKHVTEDYKKEANRNKVKRYRAKIKQNQPRKPRMVRKKPRIPFDEQDAEKKGVYQCKKPILEYKESLIPNAGNGIFALVDLIKGDIVTWFSGEKMSTIPHDRSYTIQLSSSGLYIDGIKIPAKGQGMGSFINKESRTFPRCRKNCDFLEVGSPDKDIYIIMIKDVKKGEELYTTYDHGYRL